MRLLYVADARSPIALNWIRYFVARGDEVHLISSTPALVASIPGLASLSIVPLALTWLHSPNAPGSDSSSRQGRGSALITKLRHGTSAGVVTDVRYLVSSLEIHRHVKTARQLIGRIRPDLVHAMRIPFEGVLAALANDAFPLLTSVWGNDFTLFARRYSTIASLTRRTLKRTDALHCDCRRDLNLAMTFGFDSHKPSIVLPGAGGVQDGVFNLGAPDQNLSRDLNIPASAEVIINPRGFRGYVRNDVFFRSIPLILERRPNAVFLCSAMAGNPIAEAWLKKLGIAHAVRLLPGVERVEMAQYFRLAAITVSLSEHDGTPNTLLEAMACGCFPVAGDIETTREWITPGENGLLCDPADPRAAANAILQALEDSHLRERARTINLGLIAERADYKRSMATAAEFYARIVDTSKVAGQDRK
jgi:glycosyltransferase involved in cell wall biosynthesis